MKKNKGLKIAIIILIILIVLVIAALALLYVFTDLFKSDKQLFAKYVASMMDEKTAFFPATLEEYENKKESTPYENNGSFSANITASNSSSTTTNNTATDTTSPAIATADPTAQINSMLNFANNTRINFSGKIDRANQKNEQDINIFYNNDVSLPFKFKQVGDIYALQADFVLPNYIGIENNNIPELLQKFGINVNSVEIPSKIEGQEIQSLKLSADEISHLYNNYVVPVINNLTDDKFSKSENADRSIGYTITLTYEDIKNIFIQELQTLSQDTVVIDKINSIYQEMYNKTDTIITSDDINDLIANLQETEVDEGDITITITQKDGSVNQISLNIATESKNSGVITRNEENTNINTDESGDLTETIITISKNETNSNLTYNVDLTMQNSDSVGSVGIEMSYNNINTDTVAENYNITANLNNMTNIEYNFSNNVNFTNAVNIEDFDLNNTIVLNNYPDTEVQTFMSQLGAVIAQKNTSQMQEIGYPTELINPMYMWIMGPSLSLYIYNSASSTIGSADLNSQAVAVYNQEFLQYEGTRTGSQVRALINSIETHNTENANDPSKQIQITSENYGANGGTLAAPTTSIVQNEIPAVLSGKTYIVTFAYDPTTGYITACGIVESESGNSSTNTTINNSSEISQNDLVGTSVIN